DSAKGRIRTEVGRALGLRLTPTIEFVEDALPDGAHRIEEALREAAAHDAEVARRAAGAAYAGDPDPYVTKPEAPDAADETEGARHSLSQGEPGAVRPGTDPPAGEAGETNGATHFSSQGGPGAVRPD
ncbi:MAG: hypothetical protein LBL01_07365, partial [Bifidobacteriaceae bacterium]|nr:hypothetical protein [Bifidobacteriaceae bacterium]